MIGFDKMIGSGTISWLLDVGRRVTILLNSSSSAGAAGPAVIPVRGMVWAGASSSTVWSGIDPEGPGPSKRGGSFTGVAAIWKGREAVATSAVAVPPLALAVTGVVPRADASG